MGLGDPIAHRIVGHDDAGDDHHATAFLRPQQTSVIDYLCAVRAARKREQLGLFFGG